MIREFLEGDFRALGWQLIGAGVAALCIAWGRAYVEKVAMREAEDAVRFHEEFHGDHDKYPSPSDGGDDG